MGDATGYALLSVAVSTALLHTLIPDHWLPFVLIGRARGWSARTTAAISGLSALIHVALSIALGLAALVVGLSAAGAVGATLERAGPWLLVGFGLAYAGWAWKKGGHFHPGGARLHAGSAGSSTCDGHEGPGHPDHLHYHADDAWIGGRARRDEWWLAWVVGLNPCVLLMPILFSASREGRLALVLVLAAYVLPTVALMVGLSVLGVAATKRLKVPGVARYMECASGLLVAALGAVQLLA